MICCAGDCVVLQCRAFHAIEPKRDIFTIGCNNNQIAQGPSAMTEPIGKDDEMRAQIKSGDVNGKHIFLRRQLANCLQGDRFTTNISINERSTKRKEIK